MDYVKQDCGCSPSGEDISIYNSDIFRKDIPLAMSYVPWQKWEQINDSNTGFSRGTIFNQLYLPFAPGYSNAGNCGKRGDSLC
ncbi:MAG: spore coat associated protein CotJA [Lachnospiraceae bacterium]|nr:spore coat associated protein CotJA [Lachnospiraceae bacterium]